MADFGIKRNATQPALEATLKYDDGTAVDLTGASVTFSMKDRKGNVIATGSAAVQVPATAGKIKYSWIAADTKNAGDYKAEFEVDFGGGNILKAPSDPTKPFIEIRVSPDIV